MADLKNIDISSNPLSPSDCQSRVQNHENGAISMFIGTVRQFTNKEQVEKLFFEAYEPMAIKEMSNIAERAKKLFELKDIVIHHRIGTLDLGEIAVIIAVGAPHRKAAIDACHFAIDSLKESVPIWKKEFFTNGEVWVNAHP